MIILGEDTLYRKANESVFIPVKTKHRIKNNSDSCDLVFIEVQTGEKLDENDIIRFEDNYGRADK
jgi:mannose-1-phosphate guanylyltransferase